MFKWNSSSLHILILKKLEVTLKIMKNTYILINGGKMWRSSGILSVQANGMPANISRTAICSHSIHHHISLTLIFTARKRSLGQGNIFTSVCQEFCSRGGCLLGGGGCLLPQGSAPAGVPGPRGCLVETPPAPDGYCCARYASYWNAFLFFILVWFWVFFWRFRATLCTENILLMLYAKIVVFSHW